MILGEVPAEVPALINLLGPLVQLCGLIVGLAAIVVLAYAVKGLLQGIASWLSFLPGVGGVAASAVTGVEQRISNALGQAIAGIESNIGHQWHSFSRVLGMLWAEQKLVAQNLWHLAQGFYHAVPLSDFTKLLHRLESRVTHIAVSGAGAVARDLTRFEKSVRATEHRFANRLGALEAAIAHTIPREIGNLWGETKALEDSLGRLWDRVRSIPTSAEIAAVIAAAIAALGLPNLDFLRCPSFGRLWSKWGCGLGTLLDDLLGLALAAIALEGVCEFLPLLEDAFGTVVGPAVHLLNEVPLGKCEQVPGDWATLNVAAGPLPPPQTLGTLAA